MAGKTLLIIAMFHWGPNFPTERPDGTIMTFDMGTEEACLAAVEDEIKNAQGNYHGRIGNLPGWYRVDQVWCEAPTEPWPTQ